jgi:hypothetical protein
MKKTLFAILALLFTIVLIATCDLLEEPSGVVDDDSPRFTPDGRPMVRVTLDLGNGGASRALIASYAEEDTKDYEVVFLDSTTQQIYRRQWSKPTTSVTLSIPVGDYAGADKAVVFAGTSNTLLAVGRISSIGTELVTDHAQINEGNNYVTFTLHRLESYGGTSDTHSFSIVGGGSTTKETIDDSFFAFEVPSSSNSITGQYKIYGSALTNYEGIRIKESWSSSSSTAFTTSSIAKLEGDVTVNGPATYNSSDKLPQDGNLTFTIDTSNVEEPGYSMIYINVPVLAINGSSSTDNNSIIPGEWYIRC